MTDFMTIAAPTEVEAGSIRDDLPDALVAAWRAGTLIPYLGPRVLDLVPACPVPATPEALAVRLTSKASVPHKIRGRLTQAAQFIENFKHRKTLAGLMNDAFAAPVTTSPLHRVLALRAPPVIVDAWYDATMAAAMREWSQDGRWGEVQGLSQSEHFGTWTGWYDAAGTRVPGPDPHWRTILYKPLGSVTPAGNYLVSDSDFVEVLTEIDIQTPIPDEVQLRRKGRSFLYLGCRFDDQLARSFARQISKRSAGGHWAVLPDAPTRMEARFLVEQGITRIAMSLGEFAERVATLGAG
jgi:hypothetical protein